MSNLSFTFVTADGSETRQIPLHALIAKGGNTYWALAAKQADGTYKAPYQGFKLTLGALGLESLPRKVRIYVDGESSTTVTLDQGYNPNSKPQVKARQLRNIPGVGDKMVNVTATHTGDQAINLKVSINGAGGPVAQDSLDAFM